LKGIARAFTVVGAVALIVAGSASAANADIVEVNPPNLVPAQTSDADKPCVGFDSTSGHEAVIVYYPNTTSRLVVVGGLYVNTVNNCIG